ncbi:MAG: calcium-binding protein [Elainella sp.]
MLQLSKGRRLKDITLTSSQTAFRGIGQNEVIRAGGGDDLIYGNRGDDIISGNWGDDFISGGEGDDALDGGFGFDQLAGGAGNDVLDGDQDDDLLNGQTGNDVLMGGLGNDVLQGCDDNDLLQGGLGRDTLLGGQGADIYYWSVAHLGPDEVDRVLDFEQGTDKLAIRGFSYDQSQIVYSGNLAEFDIDRDGQRDLAIQFTGAPIRLTASDFVTSDLGEAAATRWISQLSLTLSFSFMIMNDARRGGAAPTSPDLSIGPPAAIGA